MGRFKRILRTLAGSVENIFIKPRQEIPLQKHEKWWNRQPSGFLKKRFLRNNPPESLSREIVRNVVAKNGVNVLDVGCGPGIDLEGLKKQGINVNYTGVDVSSKMIKVARELHPGHDFRNARIESLPFSDKQFKTTVCRHLLEHVADYRVAIQELLRVTDKTAVIVFFVPPHEGKTKRKMTHEGVFISRYNKKELTRFIESLGWHAQIIEGIKRQDKPHKTETVFLITRN